jgi:molybdate transport system substrate-binding protein
MALLLAAAACSAGGQQRDDPPGAAAPGAAAPGAVSGELIVFAAASLTDAFEGIARAFTAAHPGVRVTFNLAGSTTLAAQVNQGAPADVLASADTVQMDVVAAAGNLAGEPAVFASNRLMIAVEPGNPFGVTGLEDLAVPGLVLVLPAEDVPAGRYARQALASRGVTVTPASLELDVRATMSRVLLGEADAAIVYESDVIASGGRVEGVAIPREHNVVATYPIVVLAGARNPTAAEAFVAFVLDAEGQAILADHGFTAP